MLVKVIKEVGHDNTSWSSELDRVGRKLLKKKFKGVFTSDGSLPKSGYCIVNLDKSNEPGSHWLGRAVIDGKIYWYDSFSRDLKTDDKEVVMKGKSAEQKESETNCGQRSMAFLLCADQIGSAILVL